MHIKEAVKFKKRGLKRDFLDYSALGGIVLSYLAFAYYLLQYLKELG